jgi:hypothetical protein
LKDAPRRTPRLNPVLRLGDQLLVLIPQQMASVPIKTLHQKVGSPIAQSDEITDAVHVLLTGF